MKLSPAMLDVLRRLCNGERLYRWPGGFWATRPAPEGWSYSRDGWPRGEWHTGAGTIRALERRGLLERCFADPREWRDHRQITEAGRRAACASVWLPDRGQP